MNEKNEQKYKFVQSHKFKNCVTSSSTFWWRHILIDNMTEEGVRLGDRGHAVLYRQYLYLLILGALFCVTTHPSRHYIPIIMITMIKIQASRHKTRNVDPMLVQCWANVEGGGSTLKQHRDNCSCLLGCQSSDRCNFVRYAGQALGQCWENIEDVGPTLGQFFINFTWQSIVILSSIRNYIIL